MADKIRILSWRSYREIRSKLFIPDGLFAFICFYFLLEPPEGWFFHRAHCAEDRVFHIKILSRPWGVHLVFLPQGWASHGGGGRMVNGKIERHINGRELFLVSW